MTCLWVNLLLIYAAVCEAGCLWASLQAVTFCSAVGLVKMSQSHGRGGGSHHATPVISAACSGPGWTTQAVTQANFWVLPLSLPLSHRETGGIEGFQTTFFNSAVKDGWLQRLSEPRWEWFMGAVWKTAVWLRPGQALFVILRNVYVLWDVL